MRQYSFVPRLLTLVYFATATASVFWLLLQGDWNVTSWVTTAIFVLFLGLTIATAYVTLTPENERLSLPHVYLSARQTSLLRCAALALPVPFVAFSLLFASTYLSFEDSLQSRAQTNLCIAVADTFWGPSCAEELTSQFAGRACRLAEQAEIAERFQTAEKLYRLQSNYQWLAGRDIGPLAQTGLVAAGAMADKLGRSHEADIVYAVAEGMTHCRYTNKDRRLSVIYGSHLLKLLKNVPDAKLPPSWYLTQTTIQLRRSSAAQAALICCPFDFIIEHDCSQGTFTPKFSAIKEAEDIWTRKLAIEHTPRMVEHRFVGSDVRLSATKSTHREFSTRALRRYLSRIDEKIAAENLGFYNEFRRYATIDIDEKLLPDARTCSVGFPFAARQLVSHHVWRISERDYVGMMLLAHDSPHPQFMCVDQSSSLVRTY